MYLRLVDETGKFITRIESVSYVEGSSGELYIEKECGQHFTMNDVVIDQVGEEKGGGSSE